MKMKGAILSLLCAANAGAQFLGLCLLLVLAWFIGMRDLVNENERINRDGGES